MVDTYAEYISRYMMPGGVSGLREPGEHFVSVYLVPKLFEIRGIVPDYVNPDGTKLIHGDVVYFKDGVQALGIEVKLGTIRLTTNEFNSWILDSHEAQHPDVFVGIGTYGLVVQRWIRSVEHQFFAEPARGRGTVVHSL